jgi:hypothetical protein
LQTSVGALSVRFGEKGMLSMLNSGGWTGGGLDAAGALTITSGPLFNGEVVSSGIQGRQGLTLNIGGAESSWKVEKSAVHAGEALGVWYPLAINSSAAKTSIEWSDVQVRGGSSVRVELSGAETKLSLKGVYRAGFADVISIRAMGAKSEIVIDNSVFDGFPSLVVESGVDGVTKLSGPFARLSANSPTGGSLRFTAGLGGSCFHERGLNVGPGGTIFSCI